MSDTTYQATYAFTARAATPAELAGLFMDPNRPKTEAEHWAVREIERQRAENERLRARVVELREPLAIYVHAHTNGNSVPPHIETAARAALEAKP